MKRKFLLFASILALALSGCGDKDNNKPEPPKPEKTYTVTWTDYNGTVLETDTNVKKGDMPHYDSALPTREATAQYTYTFYAWSPALTPVERDVTYMATYTANTNEYTITWCNYDGTVLKVDENVPYGTEIYYSGETPSKPSTVEHAYYFNTWEPEVTPVRGNATYTAVFDEVVRHYRITWKNYDDTTLKISSVAYGTVPQYNGINPTKPEDTGYTYSFSGWSPEVVAVTGDATYTAQYNAVPKTFSVTFYDEDGTTVIENQTVAYGETPTAPTPNVPEDTDSLVYEYSWDKEITAVTGDTTYTASYNSSPLNFQLVEDHYEVKGTLDSNYSGEIVIPSTWRGLPVTTVASQAFNNQLGITKVTIQDGVEFLSDFAFQNCDDLVEIVFPNTHIELNYYNFSYLDKLEYVKLGDDIKLGIGAFCGCSNLLQVETGTALPDFYGYYQFSSCRALTEVINNTNENINEFGDGDTYLLDIVSPEQKGQFGKYTPTNSDEIIIITYTPYDSSDVYAVNIIEETGRNKLVTPDYITKYKTAFCYGKESVEHIYVNENIVHMGKYPFAYSKVIDVHFLGTGDLEIPGDCFEDCKQLTTVDFGNRAITYLGGSCFYGCTSLTSFTIPDTVYQINNILGNSGITSLNIPASVTTIKGNPAYSCKYLTQYTVDASSEYFKAIDGNLYSKDEHTLYAYASGKSDTTFTIPEGVTKIGSTALVSTVYLTTINLPSTIEEFGYNAIGAGTALTSITYPGTMAELKAIPGYNGMWNLPPITCSDGVIE